MELVADEAVPKLITRLGIVAATFELASNLPHGLSQQPEYLAGMSWENLFVAMLIGASLISLVVLAGVLLWR